MKKGSERDKEAELEGGKWKMFRKTEKERKPVISKSVVSPTQGNNRISERNPGEIQY